MHAHGYVRAALLAAGGPAITTGWSPEGTFGTITLIWYNPANPATAPEKSTGAVCPPADRFAVLGAIRIGSDFIDGGAQAKNACARVKVLPAD